MEMLEYRDGVLQCEDVTLEAIAKTYGTPVYVYSRSTLRHQFRALADAMAEVDPLVCYSVKANSNGEVIRTFLAEGAGLDIVSGGELYRALRAGADPSKIVFAGVGKTREEIEYALGENILFFTVESEPEAARISDCAQRMGVTGRIAFRANPDVDPQTHRYISTGKKENKFGLDLDRVARAYDTASRLPGLEIAGLHMHIGSQILSSDPYADALSKIRELCASLKGRYPTFRTLDIGGGLGIRYRAEDEPLAAARFAERIVPLLKEIDLSVVMEPGRSLVGNAGVLVCRVQYVKENADKRFVVVDAAMNDLIRPSLYQAYHEVVCVSEGRGSFVGDLVGPICESGDFIAQDRDLPVVAEGDLLVVKSAGAYGFTMSSNYNSRPRAAEVMVEERSHCLIRRRETWEDLVQGEV